MMSPSAVEVLMRRFDIVTAAALAALVASAGPAIAQHTSPLKGPYKAAETPAELKPALERAQKAFAEFQARMEARMKEETARGGLAAAYAVYRDEAATITADLGRRHSGRFGRTSDKLRDPRNAPPQWAKDLVARAGTPAVADAPTWVVPIGTNVGVLAPLDTREGCVLCHGPIAAIPPETAATIRVTYPGDRATGYEVGQVRGWIWAEIPRR
jgi:hypothetical protein